LLGRLAGPLAVLTNFFSSEASAPQQPRVNVPFVTPLPGVSPYSGQLDALRARGIEDPHYLNLLRLHNLSIQNQQASASLPASNANQAPSGATTPASPQPGPRIKEGSAGGPTAGRRFTDADRRAQLKEEPTQTCVYCLTPGAGTHLDHKIAKSRTGNRDPENRQWACPHCNLSKGARDVPKTPPPGYEGPWPPPHWDEQE
jgi:hypothetical protein